ncbi:hypothetical protein A2311_03755 [candidate division WOR-1 bacterium RIFOXYB2_FULL_48_7]|uniref:4Fe-4S ferredoxin-type domain-containing protein n=1 Tax=candidate division WOR-1 bacterium RIFOXYB2_FULL_48_7 TaxID=1802583 RepID=A0A1F4TFB5_UNCSA|nr:MAG: hypothetical protein A2311_03755 [candidate division WOR-1 bacterium RIFOXYB2_FULL_48_7]
MAKRKIVHIDENKCNGCGLCVPNCHEGAIKVIDGKARLVSDVYCDGLGACLGHCPQDAITLEEREAAPFELPTPAEQISELRQWPIQLHLVPPQAPYFQGKDLLLSADCVAYALGDFHSSYLRGKNLVIACPKLDAGQEIYRQKLVELIDESKINTLTVMIMEVPCCGGLLQLARQALAQAKRKVPVKLIVVGRQGNINKDEWL